MAKSVMIVGVGGQGSLLASKLMGNLLTAEGHDVKVSEVHGMSQRGGSVVTYVKYGDKVSSPIIDKGEADFIVAFERLEAARWLAYLRNGGKLLVNDRPIAPMPVIVGAMEYPQDVCTKLKSAGVDLLAPDALSLAEQAGSAKAVNVVMLGVLSALLEFSEEAWLTALKNTVAPRLYEINERAFKSGRGWAQGSV